MDNLVSCSVILAIDSVLLYRLLPLSRSLPLRAASDMDLELALVMLLSRQKARDDNQILPVDLMILIFTHLSRHPQDLLNCALTIRQWTRPALQELYRHPWTYLFTYQFDTEGRVMDKHGSMLLLRTLFHGCMDPSKTLLPYASFARSVNLKWVQDTFDLPEVNIQTLTGFRWTRNEAPKDFLIRSLLTSRPYLHDFVHCLAPRLPRCLFAHLTTATVNLFAEDVQSADAAATAESAIVLEGTEKQTTLDRVRRPHMPTPHRQILKCLATTATDPTLQTGLHR